MPTHDRRTLRRTVVALGFTVLVMTVACWPTSRFVGVNFVVTQQSLPLWVKAIEFVDRDVNFARIADAVLGGSADDEAKSAAALAWIRTNIKPTPLGLPVVDDHIWHVIVRGYGESDQQADVFTTMLAYEGVRAYWALIGAKPDEKAISYVRIRDRWRVFDVAKGLAFRNSAGDLATPDEIAADLELIRAAAAPVVNDIEDYMASFAGYVAPAAPDVLRADLQMPGRRLWHETRKLFGMQGREWQMRPSAVPARAEVRP